MSTTLAPWAPEQIAAILASKSLRDSFIADMQAKTSYPAAQAHIVRRYTAELQRLEADELITTQWPRSEAEEQA